MANLPTVLVVEDEPLIAEIVVSELEEAGYQVLAAMDGDAALALLEAQSNINALFTDIRMPGATDGWSLAERARQGRPNLAVIYASGYTSEQGRPVDGSIFLRKPYRGVHVLDALTRLGVRTLG